MHLKMTLLRLIITAFVKFKPFLLEKCLLCIENNIRALNRYTCHKYK